MASKVNGGVMTSSPESMSNASERAEARPNRRHSRSLNDSRSGLRLPFQFPHLRPQDELLAFQNSLESGIDLPPPWWRIQPANRERGKRSSGSADKRGDALGDGLAFTSVPEKDLELVKTPNYIELRWFFANSAIGSGLF